MTPADMPPSGGPPSSVVAPAPETVHAAGALVWRSTAVGLEVALVHRPKYDDWSWPKGKLDPGEAWASAAVREVLEETGLHVQLGIPLPSARYEVTSNGPRRPKVVQYWAARAVDGDGVLAHEVDEVAWLRVEQARTRLAYLRDQAQLDALAAAERDGGLDTWPLLVVRHATAASRRRWRGDDALRPLRGSGRRQAAMLVPLLTAYGAQRVVTSDAERCAATVAPYARSTGVPLRARHALSEEGFCEQPEGGERLLDELLDAGQAAVLCTHRPVLSAILDALARLGGSAEAVDALHESAGPGLIKAETLVAHLTGRGRQARLVAVERHTVPAE